MTLTAMLISLAADRFFPAVQDWRHLRWFTSFAHWLRKTLGPLGDNTFGAALTLLLPVLAVWLIWQLLDAAGLLIGFAFAVAVLIFSLGPRNLDAQIDAYLAACQRGDDGVMQREAETILHETIRRPARPQRALVESILIQAHERVLAVLFWFAVLGPAGALLYRLACVLKTTTLPERPVSRHGQAALYLHSALDWLPARLTGLGYALSGSFVDALANWRETKAGWVYDWQASNSDVLLSSGLGALKLDSDTKEEVTASANPLSEIARTRSAQGLAWRTLVTWLVVVALMTLADWAS